MRRPHPLMPAGICKLLPFLLPFLAAGSFPALPFLAASSVLLPFLLPLLAAGVLFDGEQNLTVPILIPINLRRWRGKYGTSATRVSTPRPSFPSSRFSALGRGLRRFARTCGGPALRGGRPAHLVRLRQCHGLARSPPRASLKLRRRPGIRAPLSP